MNLLWQVVLFGNTPKSLFSHFAVHLHGSVFYCCMNKRQDQFMFCSAHLINVPVFDGPVLHVPKMILANGHTHAPHSSLTWSISGMRVKPSSESVRWIKLRRNTEQHYAKINMIQHIVYMMMPALR